MKIPHKLENHDLHGGPSADVRALDSDIRSAKKNDWNSRSKIHKAFLPLLTQRAQKRASDKAEINKLVEKGKEGINKAVKKFNVKDGANKFRIFAVNYIEAAMDGKGGGFFSKLFGG